MPKRKTRTIIDEEEEIQDKKGSIPRLIKDFFEMRFLDDRVKALPLLKCRARLIRRDSKRVSLTGAEFTDLEEMLEVLSRRYPRASFDFFIMYRTEQMTRDGMVKIADYPIETLDDGDDGEPGEYPETETIEGTKQPGVMEILLAQIASANQNVERMMQQNTAIIIAALGQKGGGGLTTKQMTDILRLGVKLGEGGQVDDPEGDEDPTTGILEGIMGTLNNPVIKKIAELIPSPAPAPAAPPQAPAPPGDNGHPNV